MFQRSVHSIFSSFRWVYAACLRNRIIFLKKYTSNGKDASPMSISKFCFIYTHVSSIHGTMFIKEIDARSILKISKNSYSNFVSKNTSFVFRRLLFLPLHAYMYRLGQVTMHRSFISQLITCHGKFFFSD